MTAAALKPNLFSHLFASNPDRFERESFGATAASVVLHASVVAALIWAGGKITHIAESPFDEVTPIILAPPQAASAAPPSVAPVGPPGAVAITPPAFIPPDIPAPTPGDPPIVEPIENPGPPAPPGGKPGPPAQPGADPSPGGGFAVIEKLPALLNGAEVRRALERNYPALLRDAGVGGLTNVWVLLDENGRVVEAKIKDSSGHSALDDVALKVAPLMRFSPAMQRDQHIKVWANVPIRFTTN
jgi:periplasmic protein TonB